MSNETEDDQPQVKKSRKMPLLLGLVLALAGGGGGFYAVWSGMILAEPVPQSAQPATTEIDALPDIAFVPVDPLTISLSDSGKKTHLRFRAQLEVPSNFRADVELLLPRVVDVMNGYLRALETSDIERPSSLARLRAQLLRRVKIVTGDNRVNDLLIMEFVVN